MPSNGVVKILLVGGGAAVPLSGDETDELADFVEKRENMVGGAPSCK